MRSAAFGLSDTGQPGKRMGEFAKPGKRHGVQGGPQVYRHR